MEELLVDVIEALTYIAVRNGRTWKRLLRNAWSKPAGLTGFSPDLRVLVADDAMAGVLQRLHDSPVGERTLARFKAHPKVGVRAMGELKIAVEVGNLSPSVANADLAALVRAGYFVKKSWSVTAKGRAVVSPDKR